MVYQVHLSGAANKQVSGVSVRIGNPLVEYQGMFTISDRK